jgi:hypothetical protein
LIHDLSFKRIFDVPADVLSEFFCASPLINFLDAGSFFMVFIPAQALSFGAHGKNNVLDVFRDSRSEPTPNRARELAVVVSSCGNNFMTFGWIGMLVGAVKLLGHLDDVSKLTPAVAVMLLSLFYGICVKAMLFGPLSEKYRRISARLSV